MKLSRYTFNGSGTPYDQGSNAIDVLGSYQELSTSTKGNATAKENIESETEGFRGSAIKNGGYYIGRYEARDGTTDAVRTRSTSDTNQITVRSNNYVYNLVTQPQAASLSQGMYNDGNFESDLMNSYAWDTAIVFLQECDNRENKTIPYSRQNSLNTDLAEKGTNETENEDVICNVFDMASNCYEWTTEGHSGGTDEDTPCVFRGGFYTYIKADGTVERRYYATMNDDSSTSSFRPILYL